MRITKRILMRANDIIRKKVFTQRRLIRLLFDVNTVVPTSVQGYCEWATIHQRFIMRRDICNGDRILDIGTGAHAILAIFAKKHFPNVSVLATDILPERISFAKETVAENHVDVTFMVTDMFEGIKDKFDLILFNPPAIPSHELEELGFELKSYPGLGSRYCWSADGGNDGLDVIRVFLNELGEHLTDYGRAIMTVNPIHCDATGVKKLCQKAGLTIKRIHKLLGITNAYIIAAGKY